MNFERIVLGCIEAEDLVHIRLNSYLIRKEDIRLKALGKIYKMYILLHRSDLNIPAKMRPTFLL